MNVDMPKPRLTTFAAQPLLCSTRKRRQEMFEGALVPVSMTSGCLTWTGHHIGGRSALVSQVAPPRIT